ncbi:hypothetical protein K2173_002569 [Erythroxylum novogranatense]|uniref:BHLH domain-containing protein n=1 Tax=Erythroxylum novogranatense TaxID=1862640 RepID=A0AAV8TTU4_9ROSI|nr:hypothetical protein K2173_002569 [Erythroxylum novogranatense]
MDSTSATWFTEMGMNDYEFISQYNMGTADGENIQRCSSLDSYSSYPNLNTETLNQSYLEIAQSNIERPTKQHKSSSWNSGITAEHQPPTPSSPTSQFLSFEDSSTNHSQKLLRRLSFNLKPKEEASSPGNMNFQPLVSKISYENQQSYEDPRKNQGSYKKSYPMSMTRTPSHAQEHIMAERKRREKLSQRFIALSSIVPGLKKMDKATVLGDAIKYVKQLQERVKELEEQTKKKTVESVILVRKSQLSPDEDSSSCNDSNSEGRFTSALPEIEATASGKDLLVRIHCQKQHGVLTKILKEMENLHLSIVTSSVMPFGSSTLHITIVAQMGGEETMTVKDLVRNLRLALLKFM